MPRQQIVKTYFVLDLHYRNRFVYLHTMFSQAFENLLITRHVSIIVLWPVYPVLGYIKIHAIVPGLRNAVSIIFQWLEDIFRIAGSYS